MFSSKKKVSRAGHIDRISGLSIDVIGIILQCLSHEEVVRTSVLSKKWRYMWTSVPQLELMNLKGELYSISPHIFSCEGLTHLKLHNFKVSNVPNFCCFKSLVKLHLSNIRFESNALGSLLLGCASLVTLIISSCFGFECINVPSSLKILHVQSDQAIQLIYLEKAKNLTDLSLVADTPGNNFERKTISNLLKALSKMESIYLGEGYVKILSLGILPKMLQSFNCLKYLKLYGVDFNQTKELLFIISLLKSSPNLQKLLMESHSKSMVVGLPLTLEESTYDSCCFSQLLNVNIIVKVVYKNTLNFIQFLLAHSPSLEILCFKVIQLRQDHYSRPRLFRDLKRMDRASEAVQVEFICDYMID